MVQFKRTLGLLWLCILQSTIAIDVDWGDSNSVKDAAATIAAGMMSYYVGNEYGQTPGILPGPYYWWEAGAMWGAMINYWHYTNDTTYNDLTMQGLQWQVGPHNDFMPPNASASLGNDDQAFWGMAAMAAAEYKFPNPLQSQPSWLSLAQAVFNEQMGRWDTQFCNGGIRWQIYQITGYDLKNTISNGCFFNLASRLARYTDDDLYAQWAEKAWNWLWDIGLIDSNYNVYDNTEANRLNCTTIDHTQWSYNAGTLLMGASTMWNYTQSDVWKNRTSSLLSTIVFDYFPKDGIMIDICEQHNACNVDQHSFKAYLSRWMAATTQMAPFTYNIIAPLLLSSAKAAAAQCTGAPTGNVCGLKWYLNGTWDGTAGVGQQMAALEVVLGTMVGHVTPAVTNNTGGNSASNPTAGYNASSLPPGEAVTPATKADRAGAWLLTVLFSLATLYTWYFMNTDAFEWGKPTIGGKAGKHGRTISTMEMGSSGSTVVAGVGAFEKDRGIVGTGNGNGKQAEGIMDVDGEKRHSNVLTQNQPDRASVFSSTGIFPSDAGNGHRKSASFGSGNAQRNSIRSLPPIVERDARDRDRERRRRRSTGIHSKRERERHVESRFKEEDMPSRLD